MSEDQDWRLKAELDSSDRQGALDHLIGRLRGPNVAGEVAASVPHDVVITHDGELLFAYAATEAALNAARSAIQNVVSHDGMRANISVSHWDGELDAWRQTDPPPSADQERIAGAAARDAQTVESRTMVASAGKLIRAEFEQTMREWAVKLGLRCEIIEHPHLMTTQVAFTVTGPKHKVDEFAQGLQAEELATIRTERSVMLGGL